MKDRERIYLETPPFEGLPREERVTDLCVGRDPRDVALSWDDHMANADFAAIVSARGAAVGNDDIVEELAADPAFVAWAHGGAAAPGV